MFRLFLATIIISLLITTSVSAIDRQPAVPDTTKVEQEEPDSFKPYFQLAVGFSQRLDESDLFNHTPMFQVRLYRQLTELLSTKFGVGYIHHTSFRTLNGFQGTKVNSLMLETGFRWSSYINSLGLYLENGFEYDYYSSPDLSGGEQRIGMNISAGFQVAIQNGMSLDISVSHTVNNANVGVKPKYPEDYNTPDISGIYTDHLVGIQNGNFYSELFNPTVIRFLLFYKL